eukprot:gene56924-biopygen23359
MPRFVRACWLLGSATLHGAIWVSFGYWLLDHRWDLPLEAHAFFVHGINSIVLIVDFALGCQPLPLLHGVYFQVYGMSYISLNVLFCFSGLRNNEGERYVYRNFDFRSNPVGAFGVSVVMMLTVIPAIYILTWLGVQCRQRLARWPAGLGNYLR